jgi:uncharacterized membrane protein
LRKDKGLVLFTVVMLVITLIGLGILFMLLFFPQYTKTVRWVMPIPSIIVCYFMIYTKEFIIYKNWYRLHIAIRLGWWAFFILNLVMAAKQILKLF